MNYDPITGQPINNNYQQPVVRKTNGFAIAGLICSLLVGSITGLIFSFIGLGMSKKYNDGKGLSIAGIIISILRIVFIVIFVFAIFGAISGSSAECAQATGCEELTGLGYKICSVKNSSGVTKDVICPSDNKSTDNRATNNNNNNKTAKKVKMYVFYGQGCPHCEDLFDYLDELKYDKDYKDKFEVVKYETWYNDDNAALMLDFADYFDIETRTLGVPFYVIGDEYFTGFPNPITSSQTSVEKFHNQIKNAIDKNYNNSKAVDVYEIVK